MAVLEVFALQECPFVLIEFYFTVSGETRRDLKTEYNTGVQPKHRHFTYMYLIAKSRKKKKNVHGVIDNLFEQDFIKTKKIKNG